ncbi:E3 ubiquitin-protein ligase KEG [Iris pallida]|uniref:E3 ubiquitin-protein ligase KEG n=1 Tax=Iris pallida TaxID=29817 RepID=A0AAX6GKY5_IRIPA|nr:E3 ubiquitin-protein ligase KEG [Iris pallida]
MAAKASSSQPSDSFEYMLFEGDPDHLKSVVCTPNQINTWIEPSALKLTHRIGRGPFGDVWLATHHHSNEDHARHHEVAVKMIYPIKDEQMQNFLAIFNEIFSECQGLENVCLLHGISVQNGRACIVMKFYEGSVGDKMARFKGGRLSLRDVLRYGTDIAQGILELHSKGILVLNLKPCNFLLNEHDQAILGDFGIPWLLYGLPLPSPDMVQRLGTPNYMAPEQWQPNIRGPISFETDSWGFGCSIVEMLTGSQPWHGRSPNEIYNLVVEKQGKPRIPSGLPHELENVLWGCFEYDFRNRPLMADILRAFKSCRDAVLSDDSSWTYSGNQSTCSVFTDWSLLKDHLQVGDTVRSRKPKNSCRPENMVIPEGTVVGMDTDSEASGFILVRVHGFHDPLKVLSSTVERVTYGFASGDWVKAKDEDKKHRSPVGILHSIERDGKVTVGFIGMETLWNGSYTNLQMAESYCVGQFLRLKQNVSSPRFEWPRNRGGEWATGRVSQILPNGCLVVKFPGRFSIGGTLGVVADPSEVEMVSFSNCEGVVKKYQHLEDFHWCVRPLVIALGLFSALRLGFVVGQSVGKSRRKKDDGILVTREGAQQQQEGQNGSSSAQWLPPSVANILFKEGGASPAR